MKMSEIPSFGAPESLIFVVVALKRFLVTLYQPKLGLAYPKKSLWKKIIKIFGRCTLIIHTRKEPYQCSKMLAENFLSGGNSICKTGIILSFTAKNGHGALKNIT
jgi:hypothetical protein